MNVSLEANELVPADRTAHYAVRLLYFFFFAGMGMFFSFINVYYLEIGLTGVQIGLLGMIGPLVGVFSSILWGMLTDHFGRPRLLFMLAAAGALSAVIALSGIRIFFWMVPVVVWLSLFNTPIPAMMDSTTFRLLKDHPERYGRYRMWGTCGFILTSLAGGFLFERTGVATVFPAYALTIVLFLFSTLGLPNTPIRLRTSPFDGVGQLVRQPPWLLFALSVFILWIASTGSISFVGVLIKDMGGSASLIGLNWAVAAAVELPVMFSSAFLLRRLGANRLITIAFIGYFLRILLYGLIPTPGWAVAVNVLHAFSYVPFLIGSVAYANQIAPAELKATSQGLLFSVMSMGNVIGALLSGWLYDRLGPSGLFRSLAFVALLAFIVFTTGQFLLHKRAVVTGAAG